MTTPHDHTTGAPAKSLPELRVAIAIALGNLGYGKAHTEGFLAGATLMGHLRPGGSLWYIEHAIRQHLDPAHPMDDLIEANGQASMPGPRPKPLTKRPNATNDSTNAPDGALPENR